MSGEFHMTSDPSEKDALLHVPGVGLTMMEQMGLAIAEKQTVGAAGYIGIALPSDTEKYDIIGRIVNANNRTVINFRDLAPGGQFKEGLHIAAAGSYTMTVLVRDRASGAIHTSTVAFHVN